MQRFAVLLAVVTVAVVSAQQSRPPAIEAEGTEVSIRGSDLVLRDTAGASDNPIPPVSIRGLIAEVASLRAELSEMRANMSSRDGVSGHDHAGRWTRAKPCCPFRLLPSRAWPKFPSTVGLAAGVCWGCIQC